MNNEEQLLPVRFTETITESGYHHRIVWISDGNIDKLYVHAGDVIAVINQVDALKERLNALMETLQDEDRLTEFANLAREYPNDRAIDQFKRVFGDVLDDDAPQGRAQAEVG